MKLQSDGWWRVACTSFVSFINRIILTTNFERSNTYVIFETNS